MRSRLSVNHRQQCSVRKPRLNSLLEVTLRSITPLRLRRQRRHRRITIITRPRINQGHTTLRNPINTHRRVLRRHLNVVLQGAPIRQQKATSRMVLVIIMRIRPMGLISNGRIMGQGPRASILRINNRVRGTLRRLLHISHPRRLPINRRLQRRPTKARRPVPSPLMLLLPATLISRIRMLPTRHQINQLTMRVRMTHHPTTHHTQRLRAKVGLLRPLTRDHRTRRTPRRRNHLHVSSHTKTRCFKRVTMRTHNSLPILLNTREQGVTTPISTIIMSTLRPTMSLTSPLNGNIHNINNPRGNRRLIMFTIIRRPTQAIPTMVASVGQFVALQHEHRRKVIMNMSVVCTTKLTKVYDCFIPRILSQDNRHHRKTRGNYR